MSIISDYTDQKYQPEVTKQIEVIPGWAMPTKVESAPWIPASGITLTTTPTKAINWGLVTGIALVILILAVLARRK